MKVVNFKAIKKLPVAARVVYAVAVICALIGLTLIWLDIFEVISVENCVPLAFTTGSLMLNNIVLSKHKDILYKEIGRK